jgi:hypothetical protein
MQLIGKFDHADRSATDEIRKIIVKALDEFDEKIETFELLFGHENKNRAT